MISFLKSHNVKFLFVISLFSCCLVLIRNFSGVLGADYWFIMFNLFLAWIPFLLSYSFIFFKKINFLFISLLIVWLFFIPNTFYILTDLFHLFPKPKGSVWFDLIMILSFALTGVFLGVGSLKHLDLFLRKRMSIRLVNVVVFFLIYLSSLGVYLGRFKRLNSWDVLTNYSYFQKEGLFSFQNPFEDIDFYGTTLVFAIFIYLIYYGIFNFGKKEE